MRTGKWNKMPQWALLFAILLGIPSMAALLRVGFEHGFHKLTGMMLTAVFLLIIGSFLHWKFASNSFRVPLDKEEKKRELRQLDFAITFFLALIFLTGGGLFIFCGFQSFAEWPLISEWLLQIAAFIIGGISLLLGLIFTLRIGALLAGNRR